MFDKVCNFDDGRVYMLLAVDRDVAGDKYDMKEVVRNKDELNYKLDSIRVRANGIPHNFYIYITANGRNVRKAFFDTFNEFVDMTNQIISTNNVDVFSYVDEMWLSNLQKDSSRDEKRFVIDIDKHDEELVREIEDEVDVILTKKTPDGYHILCEPFDYTSIVDDIEVKHDSLLFVEVIN